MKWERTENLPTPETADRIYFGGKSERKENADSA